MLYQVRAIPNSKQASVIQEDAVLKVKIDEAPVGGRANRRLLEILAEYFNVPENCLRIVSGYTSRNKIIEVIKNGEK